MPRYIDVDAEKLSNLHEALELLESIDLVGVHGLELTIYGITNNEMILDSAKEAIADSEEVAEEDVQIGEIAIAVPMSADLVRILSGSGLRLRREDFAYMGSGGEGIRTSSFAFAHFKSTINFHHFSKLAAASSDAWLDEFLKNEGSNKPTTVNRNIRRDEEATQPGMPATETSAPAAPAQPAQAPNPQVPKQTSVQINEAFLSRFLD